MADFGMQQLPHEAECKTWCSSMGTLVQSSWSVFQQLCRGLADACRTKVGVKWCPQASSLPLAASFPTTSETAV